MEHLAYKEGREIWLTKSGVKAFVEQSGDDNLKKNKEVFMKVLEDKATELRSTMPFLKAEHQDLMPDPVPTKEKKREFSMEIATSMVDKIPNLKEAIAILLDGKKKMIELEHQASILALEDKQRIVDNLIKTRTIQNDLDRQAVENRKRMLEVAREEFEFSEMKKKRARVDEESAL